MWCRLACIKQLEQEMTCSVCLDICVRPCTTPCGMSSTLKQLRSLPISKLQPSSLLLGMLTIRGAVCQNFDASYLTRQQLFQQCIPQPMSSPLPARHILVCCTDTQCAPAGHDFCRKCLKQALQHQRRCPKCRASIPTSNLLLI